MALKRIDIRLITSSSPRLITPRPTPGIIQGPRHLADQARAPSSSTQSPSPTFVSTTYEAASNIISNTGSHLGSLFRSLTRTSSSHSDIGSKAASEDVVVSESRVLQTSLQKEVPSKASLVSKTRFLVQSVSEANTKDSTVAAVEELCQHLKSHPRTRSLAVKEKAVKRLLVLRSFTKDEHVLGLVREALTLLGHVPVPQSPGVRILAIDGGGLRGVVAIEVLRRFEELTGRPVRELFDFVCGVSTGAIIALLTGALAASPDDCEKLYKNIGSEIFNQSYFWGTSKLVLNHAYYDTNNWAKILRENLGEKLFIQTARDGKCPKLAVVSTVVNQPRLEAFLFRNYDYSPRVRSRYMGTYDRTLWESIRASGAAPGYFEEIKMGDFIHQDGGIMINNPTALAIQESKLLWPTESIHCVVSLGNGRYEHPKDHRDPTMSSNYTSLKEKLMKIIDSATDTEAVHTVLCDLMPKGTYFRLNPFLSEDIALDEIRPEKMATLQMDARLYLRKNEHRIMEAVNLLMQHRTPAQRTIDYVKNKSQSMF